MATYLTKPLAKSYTRTRGFYQHPYGWRGIDYAKAVGSKVYAARSGATNTLYYQKTGGGISLLVQFRSSAGQLINLWGWYAHLSKILIGAHRAFVKKQVIALSGNTGASTGPHVHFYILRKHPLGYLQAIDPENKTLFVLTEV